MVGIVGFLLVAILGIMVGIVGFLLVAVVAGM